MRRMTKREAHELLPGAEEVAEWINEILLQEDERWISEAGAGILLDKLADEIATGN